MKLTKNWQRHLVIISYYCLFCLLIGIVFIILTGIYDVPLFVVVIIYIASVLSVACEPFSASKNFYKKYCNRECEGCEMWHCNVCSKADKQHCAK